MLAALEMSLSDLVGDFHVMNALPSPLNRGEGGAQEVLCQRRIGWG